MGVSTSTGRKKQLLVEVMDKQYAFRTEPAADARFPRTVLVDDKYTVVELSANEVFFAASGNLNVFSRSQWLGLFATLKKNNLAPMCVTECDEPWKLGVYDSSYNLHHVNIKTGVVRRISDDRGVLVKQYLLRVDGDNVIFINTENDQVTELTPFAGDKFLTKCWFTGLNDARDGIRLLTSTGIEMLLDWQCNGRTVALHELPDLKRDGQAKLIASVSPYRSGQERQDGPAALIEAALPAGERLIVKLLKNTTVCMWKLDSAGKNIVILLREGQGVLMLNRPQTQYSEFVNFN